VRRNDGSVDHFVTMIQDITERKQHEEQEHLLMREINHRAKNMLSVVDAIAHQAATRNPENFLERFSERIGVHPKIETRKIRDSSP
jgi:two-component sensor histidine kinase